MDILKTFFKEIRCTPPLHLEERILLSLQREERILAGRKARAVLWNTSLSTILFLVAVFFSAPALFQSEFWSLFTLLFSDMSLVINSFREYIYSLLETLPIVPLATLLFSIAVLGYSTSRALSFLEDGSERSFHKPSFIH